MTQLTKAITYKSILTLFLIGLFQVMTWAQDTSVTSTKTTTSTITEEHTWYMQPWAWVVGGAVLIIIIVALVRGNNASTGASTTDKVTYTKTTETDTNS